MKLTSAAGENAACTTPLINPELKNEHMKKLLTTIGLICLSAFAWADLAEENFDGYGAVEVSLEGLNGGTGFLDAYTAGSTGTEYPLYQPGASLAFGNAGSGYVDRGGDTAEDGHILGTATGSFNGHRLNRMVRAEALANGTVWASFVTAFDPEATDSRIFISLSQDGGTSPRFGGQDTELLARIDASNTAAGALADRTKTYLVIARLDIDEAGTDLIRAWLFPADGTYDPLMVDNLDAQAVATISDEGEVAGFQYMGIVVGNLTLLDQLRISHGEIPEVGLQEILTGEPAPEGPKLAMDNFDNYGETGGSITGIDGGLNFTGAWEEVVAGPDFNQYVPGVNLEFGNASSGYIDLNETGADDGHLVGIATGGFNNHRIVRKVTEMPINDGVVWASFVTAFDAGATEARNFFSLSVDGGAGPRFGGQGADLLARISNSIVASAAYDLSETYLVVAQLTLDGDGDDTLSVWLFPASGSYETLTPTNLDTQAAAKATDVGEATGFQYMGIVSGAGVRADQFRIAMNTTTDAAFRSIMTGTQPTVLGPPESGYVNYDIAGSTYVENFNGLTNAGNGVDLAWVEGETVTGFYRYTGVRDWFKSSDGRDGANPLLAYGQVDDHPDAADKALGLRNHPGTEAPTIFHGVLIYNDTLQELTGFNLVFDAEQWYGNSSQPSLVAEYSLNADSVNDGGAIWRPLEGGVFNAPHGALPAAVQYDGNAAENRADDISVLVSDILWPAGGRLWIRWGLDLYEGGSTGGLAVDDMRFVGFASGEPPVAPGGVAAAIAYSTAVDLAWQDNSDNETGFEIARRVAGETDYVVVGAVGPNITEFRDTNLATETGFEYIIRAVNAAGKSDDSEMVPITTPPPRSFVPAAPTALGLTDITASTATLAWTDNADDEWGFRVYVQAAADEFAEMIAQLAPDATDYVIPNLALTPSTAYDLIVVAFNADGESDPAGPVSFTTLDPDERYARLQLGWIDVTQPPYNVDPTGVQDAWPVIQAVLDSNVGNDGTGAGRILYFPDGEYLFSDALTGPTAESANGRMRIVGESREGTILRLKDNADGYTGLRGSVKPFIAFYNGSSTNNAFKNELTNLTVEIGSGNAGAIAVQFHSNNCGAIRNVTIRSLDPAGAGKDGIRMIIPPNGMSYIMHVRVEGFDTGIRTGHYHAALAFEHIELVGQNEVGLLNTDKPISIRALHSINTVPAVINDGPGSQVVIIDSLLQGGDGSGAAIENRNGFLFARNVRANGYENTVDDSLNGVVLPGLPYGNDRYIREYASDSPVHENDGSAAASMALPVRETPEVDLGTPEDWMIVEPSGGDDTATIQAALDSGVEIIAFKTGNYLISQTLTVGGSVRAILGNWSRLTIANDLRYSTDPVFRFQSSIHDAVLIEKFDSQYGDHSCHFIQNDMDETALVYLDSYIVMGIAYRNTGTGPVFIENVHALSGNHIEELFEPAFRFVNQEVWARQINPEDFIPQIEVDGGSLWVLGFKTGESHDTAFSAINGATVEVLGGVVNRSVGTHFVPEDLPMLVDHDSSMSVVLVERSDRADDPNEPEGQQRFRSTLIVDSLNGETTGNLLWTEFPLRGGPTYGVAIPLYIGYERETFPLWYQAYPVHEDVDSTMWRIPWFGNFSTFNGSDWIHHRNLGFLFPATSTVDELVLYHPELGWLYTSFGWYPFIYGYEAGT
jgi:hypothetical protein